MCAHDLYIRVLATICWSVGALRVFANSVLVPLSYFLSLFLQPSRYRFASFTLFFSRNQIVLEYILLLGAKVAFTLSQQIE